MLKTEARKLLAAEEHYQDCKGALEQADRDRAKARERCLPLLLGEPSVLAGDISITVTPCVSGKSFRLAQYLRKHKISKAMEPFIGEGTPYDRWTVKRVTT
jgi:hypothetical protein